MKYSLLFAKTSKTAPHDAESVNARLLQQAGFVHRVMAGAYAWLPLGLRTLRKVENIIREEMDAIGGQELHLTALQPKENWLQTNRWDSVDVLFKIPSQTEKEYALGPTAEEIVTPTVQAHMRSYKEFPMAVYQIQTKFRDELRAKSGVLRGREFLMKDLYSFHTSREDFERFYEEAKRAYFRVFERCGLKALITESSGGSFSNKVSHEFQVETPAGEDKLLVCRSCDYAVNSEIAQDLSAGVACPKCSSGKLEETKGIEVGNIFDLGDKFATAFDFKAQGPDGQPMDIIMGCYGIGVSRLVGAVVEALADEKGMRWPASVAPYHVFLASLSSKDEAQTAMIRAKADELEAALTAAGVDVLHDDRDARAGEKFADADLIGLPLRIVLSEKSLAAGGVEWKERGASDAMIMPVETLVEHVQNFLRRK